jgi:hypothetical protein
MKNLQAIRSNGNFHVQIDEAVMNQIFDSLNCGNNIKIGYLTGVISSGKSKNVIDVDGVYVPPQDSQRFSSEPLESQEESFLKIKNSGKQVVGMAVTPGYCPVLEFPSDIKNRTVYAHPDLPDILLLINSKGEFNLLN